MPAPAAAACFLILAACGERDGDPGPGGVTVGEARALDEAAEMLDRQRLPDGAADLPDSGTGEAPPPAEGGS